VRSLGKNELCVAGKRNGTRATRTIQEEVGLQENKLAHFDRGLKRESKPGGTEEGETRTKIKLMFKYKWQVRVELGTHSRHTRISAWSMRGKMPPSRKRNGKKEGRSKAQKRDNEGVQKMGGLQ